MFHLVLAVLVIINVKTCVAIPLSLRNVMFPSMCLLMDQKQFSELYSFQSYIFRLKLICTLYQYSRMKKIEF